MMLINGVETNFVSAFDRGLSYGDGIFRTLKMVSGRPLHWSYHYDKLVQDAQALGLSCPAQQVLRDEMAQLNAGMTDGVIKIMLTRGVGLRGYQIPAQPETSRMVSFSAMPEWPGHWRTDGVTVRVCQLRLAIQPRLAGIKHLNRLEQVLARSEWQDATIAEGILLDQDGGLVGGVMSNVFLWHNQTLLTPRMDRCGVAGVTRAVLIEQAMQAGIPVYEDRLTLENLLQAQEVLLCNSLFGAWQIRQLNQHRWPAGQMIWQVRNWLENA